MVAKFNYLSYKNRYFNVLKRVFVSSISLILILAPISAASLFFTSQNTFADSPTLVGGTPFTDPNPEPGDSFGSVLATSGSSNNQVVVIGSSGSTVNNNPDEGAAYVYVIRMEHGRKQLNLLQLMVPLMITLVAP